MIDIPKQIFLSAEFGTKFQREVAIWDCIWVLGWDFWVKWTVLWVIIDTYCLVFTLRLIVRLTKIIFLIARLIAIKNFNCTAALVKLKHLLPTHSILLFYWLRWTVQHLVLNWHVFNVSKNVHTDCHFQQIHNRLNSSSTVDNAIDCGWK